MLNLGQYHAPAPDRTGEGVVSNLFQMLFHDQIQQKQAERARAGLVASQQVPETPQPADYNKPYPALSAMGVGANTESTLPVAPTEEGGATTATVPSPLTALMQSKPAEAPYGVTPPEAAPTPPAAPPQGLLAKMLGKTPEATPESPSTNVPMPDYVPPERAYNQQVERETPAGMPAEYYSRMAMWGNQPTEQKMLGQAMQDAMANGDYAQYSILKRMMLKPKNTMTTDAQGNRVVTDVNNPEAGMQQTGIKAPTNYQQKPILLRKDDPQNPHPGTDGVFLASFDPHDSSGKPTAIGQEVRDPMAVGVARSEAYQKAKPFWAYNSDTGHQELTNAKGEHLLSDNWYNPAEQKGAGPLVQQAADIYRTANNVKEAAKAVVDPAGMMSKLQNAGFISVLDHAAATGDFGMLHQFVNSGIKQQLTPQEYHYVVTLSNIYEGSMSARNFLGVSARTSDQQRKMIVMTLPDATDTSVAQINDKLTQYEDLVHTLSQSVPNVPAPNGVTMQQVNNDMLARRNGLPYAQSLLNKLVTMPSVGNQGAPAAGVQQPAPVAPAGGAAPAGNIFDQ